MAPILCLCASSDTQVLLLITLTGLGGFALIQENFLWESTRLHADDLQENSQEDTWEMEESLQISITF